MIDRRTFLASAATTLALSALGHGRDARAAALNYGDRQAFSFEALVERSRELATKPFVAPRQLPKEVLDKIDYDAHGKIRFNPEHALFADGPGRFPVTFFHLGQFFFVPVRMFVLDDAGGAREIMYDARYFDMPADSPAHQLPPGAGFAGFRFQEARDGKLDWKKNDWVAFLGASYFRAIGELYHMACRPEGWRWTSPSPTDRKSFQLSPKSISCHRRTGATP